MGTDFSFLDYMSGVVAEYRAEVADKDEHLSLLRWQIGQGHALDQRTTYPGHVVTSAIVLSADRTQVLLIDHITIGRWLFPGGHYEGDGLLWRSAEREAIEETALPGLTLHPWHRGGDRPFIIDTHEVPGKAKYFERDHSHHDAQSVFIADSSIPLIPQQDEVNGARWAPIAEIDTISKRALPRLRKYGMI